MKNMGRVVDLNNYVKNKIMKKVFLYRYKPRGQPVDTRQIQQVIEKNILAALANNSVIRYIDMNFEKELNEYKDKKSRKRGINRKL